MTKLHSEDVWKKSQIRMKDLRSDLHLKGLIVFAVSEGIFRIHHSQNTKPFLETQSNKKKLMGCWITC